MVPSLPPLFTDAAELLWIGDAERLTDAVDDMGDGLPLPEPDGDFATVDFAFVVVVEEDPVAIPVRAVIGCEPISDVADGDEERRPIADDGRLASGVTVLDVGISMYTSLRFFLQLMFFDDGFWMIDQRGRICERQTSGRTNMPMNQAARVCIDKTESI